MIEPRVVKKLMSDVPEMREFVAFINDEVDKLNKLDDSVIDSLSDPIEFSIHIKARKEAYKILQGILDPLLNKQIYGIINSNKDYIT